MSMVVGSIKKKCPECGSKAVRLYQNKTVEGKRKWIPVAWQCTSCNYVYNVASDTLMYALGGEIYQDSYQGNCPKCDLKLRRIFMHKNPVYGKQEFLSVGWYCTRCKYTWMDKK